MDKCGIYKITNIINGKIYIGQSRPGSKNGRSKISEMEANSIKNRLNNGERICDIYNDYKDKCSIDVIKNISQNKTWK